MNKFTEYVEILILTGFLFLGFWLGHKSNSKYKREAEELRNNQTTLLQEVHKYKTSDSLNAIKVGTLKLSIEELEYFRAEDAKTIKSLKTKNRKLSEVNTVQTNTMANIQAPLIDTVFLLKENLDTLRKVEFHDPWIDFLGLIKNDTLKGTFQIRDSLLLVESVTYKRFLGFLWRTKRIKSQEFDAVSKNPHTEIQNVEHIILKK